MPASNKSARSLSTSRGGGIRLSVPPFAPLIEHCYISHNAGSGVFCSQSIAPVIEHSVLSGNTGDGVLCGEGANPEIHYNDILPDNLGYGVRNTSSAITVNAELNWWGHESGPTHPGNPGGQGIPVSDHVDYDPWSPTTGVVEPVSGVTPTGFELGQSFPNPFNPSTTIEFALPYSSHVTLKVYNALGQEVATLVNEERTAGSHRVSWNASGVASGVYFYSLRAETTPSSGPGRRYEQTRRFTLLR